MEEILKALAPWPVLQGLLLGLLVAAGGIWAMQRGFQDKRKGEAVDPSAQLVRLDLTDEEKRLQWTAYEQLENLEKNSFSMVKHLEEIAKAMNRIADNRWNGRQ